MILTNPVKDKETTGTAGNDHDHPPGGGLAQAAAAFVLLMGTLAYQGSPLEAEAVEADQDQEARLQDDSGKCGNLRAGFRVSRIQLGSLVCVKQILHCLIFH